MEEYILKFYKICILFLFLFVFSLGFASAADANQTADVDLQQADCDAVLTETPKTYGDLFNKINQPGDTNLTENYKFDVGHDTITQINVPLDGGKYTIEGNNFEIDASNKAGLFKFSNGEVIINNLVIRNCNSSAIILNNCSLTTNNVTFINNLDPTEGAAIWAIDSGYYSNGDKFINNYAKKGADIYLLNSATQIRASVFESKNPVYWSLIHGSNSNIFVYNTNFTDIKSRYAGAIYTTDGQIGVYNSKFRNMFANATAGAIAIKNATQLIIDYCEFENVSSAKNGGAVYIDVNSDSDLYLKGTTVINNTRFTNCSSGFGGVVLQLGGYLNILFSKFIENHASYGGGAVYCSNTTLYAAKVLFYANNVTDNGFGGACYVDYSVDIEIEGCNFTANSAAEGGAIYSFDTAFLVKSCEFSRNGEAIHSYFPGKGSKYVDPVLDKVNPDKFILNDRYLPSVVDFKGKQIVLNPIAITGSVNDSFFDLRKFNAVTPVKDQGSNGACWAFGANGALESAFLLATNITLDLSENNVQNAGIRYSYYGFSTLTESGFLSSTYNYYLSWLGATSESDDSYDELGKISNIYFMPNSYHVLDVVLINTSDVNAVKQALLKYGALTIFITGSNPNSKFFNSKTNGMYCDNASYTNHFVTLVGWNDTYSASNFQMTPQADGAWICKNSWGTGWGDNGYFYLSYYDAPLRSQDAVAYLINNTDVYNKLYQLDIAGYRTYLEYAKVKDLSYVNSYTAISDDLIAAVGTHFENAGVSYTIKITVNGNQLYTQSGKSLYSGYQTIKLNKYVSIDKNDKFSVEIAVNTNCVPACIDSRLYFESGTSVVKTAKGNEDLSAIGRCACLKVYTIGELNISTDVVKYFNPNKVEITSSSEGATISISKNSKVLGVSQVKSGKATFNIRLDPGKYVITTSYNDTEVVNTLDVAYTVQFTSAKAISMDYNGGATCKVKVLDYNGKPAAKKTVAFKIKGKTYNVKTASNGIATFKISNAVTPGTYKLTASYNGQTISKSVKVKQVLKTTKSVKVKRSAKKLVLKASLKTSSNKPIKNKKVSFKLNGKTYSGKTNSKGLVKVTIKKAAIKKLKAGKKYTIKVAYIKDVVKSTLTVKR